MEKKETREEGHLRITPGRPYRKQATHTDDTGERDGTEDQINRKDQYFSYVCVNKWDLEL